MVRPRVFLDFSVEGQPIGRLIFELYNDTAPKTTENFRGLCTGEKGRTASDIPLYYKNSIIHRSIKDFMIQGGDFTKKNGTGGESIYGGMFPDEDLTRPLDAEGLLCMANRGPDTNGSQFFITLRACPHLNGKHVVFGRVLRGYDDVVKKIIDVPVDGKDRPLNPVVIHNCGELELRKQPTPVKRAAVSESESESESDKPKRKSRHRSRSKSRSPDDSDSSTRRHRRKKSKRKHKDKRDKIENKEKKDEKDNVRRNSRGETEEEYDARLEREENERLEAERKRELEKIKKKYDSQPEVHVKDGVRFKGRGRMKYMDPDVQFR